ncbi:MAG TPA: hypothetical protein VLA05_04915, partial [Coriobacteriia bacterium]|nr:hypothetical protein [Coriobacteriia bacterium]
MTTLGPGALWPKRQPRGGGSSIWARGQAGKERRQPVEDAIARLEGVRIFNVLTDIWHRRGGLTRTNLQHDSLLSERLTLPITVLTLDFDPDFRDSERRLREVGIIGRGVVVRNLYEDAGLYDTPVTGFFGENVETADSAAAPLSSIRMLEDTAWETEREDRDADNRLIRTLRSSDGKLVRRDFHDLAGRARRVELLDAEKGTVARRWMIDTQNAVRVETVRSDSAPGSWSIRFHGADGRVVRSFDSQRSMHTEWLDSYAVGCKESVFHVASERALVVRAVAEMHSPGVAKV